MGLTRQLCTVISLFFLVEIFSDGTHPKICYSNIVSTTKIFLHRNINFSHIYSEREREHVVVNSSTQWEGELKSAAVNNNCKCEGMIAMVP